MTANSTRRIARTNGLPGYLRHESFSSPSAYRMYDPDIIADPAPEGLGYMPDEVTRDLAKRMHYSAHRLRVARTVAERTTWRAAYLSLRDSIVLGNRKLVFRAVRRRMAITNYAEDMVGDCQIVLIHAVAAFDPWLGVRFSTYAYTCLIRAIGRTSQRLTSNLLARTVPFDALHDGEPGESYQPEPAAIGRFRLDEFLRDDHPLLSSREKAILTRRFSLGDDQGEQTLEKVGRSVGLSKERVRQVQESALGKLRVALVSTTSA